MSKKNIHLIAGARPNFMKIAPLYHALSKEEWCTPKIVHTGQHYDASMSDQFFSNFSLPEPDYFLSVGGGSHAEQTGHVMIKYEHLCEEDRPDVTVVVGDVNATLSSALTAVKMHIPVAHVEAGLRSGDMRMPEEINRILTDRISDFLFTPSNDADINLRQEGIEESKIHMIGNIMIDSYHMLKSKIDYNTRDYVQKFSKYFVVTMHRPHNVDDREKLKAILERIKDIAKDIPVLFPVHPRTRKNIKKFNLTDILDNNDHIILCEPLSYVDFMTYVAGADFILTDSGGVQEETTYLGIPCFTLRDTTERPVTVEIGTNRLVNENNLLEIVRDYKNVKRQGNVPPLWDGKAASRVVEILKGRI